MDPVSCISVFQIGDQTGELTAQMNLADLKKMLGINCTVSSVEQDLSRYVFIFVSWLKPCKLFGTSQWDKTGG